VISSAIGLALVAAALHGTWNVLLKISGNPIVTLQRATTAAALVLTPLVAVAWLVFGRPSFPPAAMALCAVSAALELAYAWLLSTAYRRGELSVVYPIARGSAPLLAVIAGLALLGERLAPAQLAGVALLLLGILAVTLPQTSGRATGPALLTGVAIATYTAIDRVGVRLTTPWLYGWLLVTLLAVGLVASVWIVSRAGAAEAADPPAVGPGEPRPATWRGALVIGVFMWSGYFLVLWALSLAPLSVIAPVRETAVVAVAVWGVWRLRERRAWALKLAGALATLIGVALLAV
jgi:drug/metabolite transporter (DMT)-like permease